MDFRSLIEWIIDLPASKASEPAEERSERRRNSRLPLNQGELQIPSHPPLVLTNLSHTGLQFRLPEQADAGEFPVGTSFSGRVCLGSVQFPVDLNVCNHVGSSVGCRFQGVSPIPARILHDFLKPRFLASSLREIRSSQTPQAGAAHKMRWFQGDEETELFVWEALDGTVIKEELHFLGSFVDWDLQTDVLRTGRLSQGSNRPGYGRHDQSSISIFRVPSHRILRSAFQFLKSADLPPEVGERFRTRIASEEYCMYKKFLIDEHDSSVRLELEAFPGLSPDVVHLGPKGISFLRPVKMAFEIRPGLCWKGTLDIPEHRLAVVLKPSYEHESIVVSNLEFDGAGDSERLGEYLASRLLAESLEEHKVALDELPVIPRESRPSLYIGVHNTHLLSVLDQEGALHLGRLVFMDRCLVYQKPRLEAFVCSRGIVFPREWDLPLGLTESLPAPEPEFLDVCKKVLAASSLPVPIIQAWESILNL